MRVDVADLEKERLFLQMRLNVRMHLEPVMWRDQGGWTVCSLQGLRSRGLGAISPSEKQPSPAHRDRCIH